MNTIALNTVLSQILQSGQVEAETGERFNIHSNISAEEGEFISKLILRSVPKRTLEIGLAYGISALSICEALLSVSPSAKHIAIDPMQHDAAAWKGIGVNNLRRAGYSEIFELIEKSSHLALPFLETRGDMFDLIFIDGWHTFDHALADFFLSDKVLRPGGILIIDDADLPPVHKVCRFILTNRDYKIEAVCGGAGSVPLARRIVRSILRMSPVRRFLRPELKQPSDRIGLSGSCVAFRKLSSDVRPWDFYREF